MYVYVTVKYIIIVATLYLLLPVSLLCQACIKVISLRFNKVVSQVTQSSNPGGSMSESHPDSRCSNDSILEKAKKAAIAYMSTH